MILELCLDFIQDFEIRFLWRVDGAEFLYKQQKE
jgi:hypothetical protein